MEDNLFPSFNGTIPQSHTRPPQYGQIPTGAGSSIPPGSVGVPSVQIKPFQGEKDARGMVAK